MIAHPNGVLSQRRSSMSAIFDPNAIAPIARPATITINASFFMTGE